MHDDSRHGHACLLTLLCSSSSEPCRAIFHSPALIVIPAKFIFPQFSRALVLPCPKSHNATKLTSPLALSLDATSFPQSSLFGCLFYVRPWKHNYNQHGLPQLLFLWRYCWLPGLLLRGAVPNAMRMAANFRCILYESSCPLLSTCLLGVGG